MKHIGNTRPHHRKGDAAPFPPKAATTNVRKSSVEYLIPLTVLVHLALAPYTKVEESFSIQAAHDILVYGTPTSDVAARLHESYDHLTFSGAVPRSFIGPLLLSGLSQTLVAVFGFHHAQFIVRAVLGLFNAGCLAAFSRGVGRTFGSWAQAWFVMLTCSQFHIMYYASRTLPNSFAFGLSKCHYPYLSRSKCPSASPGSCIDDACIDTTFPQTC